MEHRQFYKMSMFEGSSRVPLMMMGPGLMSGLQVNQLASLVDLYPTVLGQTHIKHIHFNPFVGITPNLNENLSKQMTKNYTL